MNSTKHPTIHKSKSKVNKRIKSRCSKTIAKSAFHSHSPQASTHPSSTFSQLSTSNKQSTTQKQPLSYRHLYHAGNHADVMKHAILVTLAAQQIRKIPFGRLYIDTHAGPGGTYDLQHEYARKTQESAHGIGRIYDIARISALNPHITSETTLRCGKNDFDHGYTQDPMYLRLHAPASDIFEPFPFVNGVASPGSKTISPHINQQRGDLIVPLMNVPHPLTQAGGDTPISTALQSHAKEGYLSKLDTRRQTISARRKLQRQMTKLRSHLQALYSQQQIIHQLKTEFALLNAAHLHQQSRAVPVEVDLEMEVTDDFEQSHDEAQQNLESIQVPSFYSNHHIKKPRDLSLQSDHDESFEDSCTDLSEDNLTDENVAVQNVTTQAHTMNSSFSKSKSPSQPFRSRSQRPQDASKSYTPNFDNFPFHNKPGDEEGSEEYQPTPSEAEDYLIDRTNDREEAGPIPDVHEEKVSLYTNSKGERVTFRRLGKGPISADSPLQSTPKSQFPFQPPPSPLLTKPKVRASGFTHKYSLDDQRITAPSKSFQENPELARKRAINVLTRRLVSQYDPIEEVADLVHNFHVELKIPTKNNSLLANHSNITQSAAFPMTRTNQLHTAQLFTYFRHLLPIPSSMLPYISLMIHASKPPTLSTLSPSANYADLLVGDGITSEKAKGLEERQTRDLMRSGSFSSSIRLNKEEKLQLHKEVVNGSMMEAYLNNVDDEYHDEHNSIISQHLLSGLDDLEKQGLSAAEFDSQATTLIGKNMVNHKPHVTLTHPVTGRPLFPLTAHIDEWVDSSTSNNSAAILSLSDSHGVINEDRIYPDLQRVPAQAILFAPDPVKSKKERQKLKNKPKGIAVKQHHLTAQRQGFEVDMMYELDEIPMKHQGHASRSKPPRSNSNRSPDGDHHGGDRRGGDLRYNGEKNVGDDFGIDLNSLGANISVQVNSISDDRQEKRAQREFFIQSHAQNDDNDDNAGDENNNNHRSDRRSNDSADRQFSRDRPTLNDRHNSSRNNNKGFSGHTDDFANFRSLRNHDNRQNSSTNLREDHRVAFSQNKKDIQQNLKPQHRQENKPKFQPKQQEVQSVPFSPPQSTPQPISPIKMSLRELKNANLTNQKRNYSSLTGRLQRRLSHRASPLISQLPPTLQRALPLSRLGLINPEMITTILSRHFSSESKTANVWKQLMEEDKDKQKVRTSHNKDNQTNKYKDNQTNKYKDNQTNKYQDNQTNKYKDNQTNKHDKSDFKGKRDFKGKTDFKGKSSDYKSQNNTSDTRLGGNDRVYNSNRRESAFGSSRQSRDKAKAQIQRLEVWNRVAPSTRIFGIEHEAEEKPQRESLSDINDAFVNYSQDIPLVTTAPVKSIYSSAHSPVDTLTSLYFKNTSKSRQQKAKRTLEKNLSMTKAISEIDVEFNYRQDLEDAVGTLFDEDATIEQRFTALTDYENYFKMAEHALSYLYRSGSVYSHSDKLYHIPLMQPLFNSPSSPWIMNNLLRDQLYSPASKAMVTSQHVNADSLAALPQHFPMIKDILVLNEIHSTEYQILRSQNGDTIFNEFYKESLADQDAALIAELDDIKTSKSLRNGYEETGAVSADTSQQKLSSLDSFHQNFQNQIGDSIENGDSKHQRANRVPATGRTLGDAISRLAATISMEASQNFNAITSTAAQKYTNFNKLNLPLSAESHGAHNIYIEEPQKQIYAFQYNGFQSAQIFLKQFQFYMDFVQRMSYSATHSSSHGVQYMNNIHDEQFQQYEQLYDEKHGNDAKQQHTKRRKNDNFISTSLILCDPAYETGEEYVQALDLLRTTLDFNSRGNAHTLAIWYPILEKIDSSLSDDYNFQKQGLDEDVSSHFKDESSVPKFDMNSVARRDINRGHFSTALSSQFSKTPKHEHHKLFLSISSLLVSKYRSTIPSPLSSNSPYSIQTPTGNLDTCVAETYVGIPCNLPKQRKNIYMSGSGMLIQSPLLPQELDQSLSTMLPWISTALHVQSVDNVYSHVVKSKQLALGDRNKDKTTHQDSTDLSETLLAPISDYTLHWM